ncbi:hypothetical protein [Albibacillus kandeliae]|uniref:hypothetical protein n=1 Tax=Albibacillus kandeliae TaxID=2174228 RepID=UPI001300B91D|nr:hypothetical protein [Albibacillus kandeliae]
MSRIEPQSKIATDSQSPRPASRQATRSTKQLRKVAFTEAQVKRFIKAARAVDPKAVIEIVTEAGTIRISAEPAPHSENPFDTWKANRNARET